MTQSIIGTQLGFFFVFFRALRSKNAWFKPQSNLFLFWALTHVISSGNSENTGNFDANRLAIAGAVPIARYERKKLTVCSGEEQGVEIPWSNLVNTNEDAYRR